MKWRSRSPKPWRFRRWRWRTFWPFKWMERVAEWYVGILIGVGS